MASIAHARVRAPPVRPRRPNVPIVIAEAEAEAIVIAAEAAAKAGATSTTTGAAVVTAGAEDPKVAAEARPAVDVAADAGPVVAAKAPTGRRPVASTTTLMILTTRPPAAGLARRSPEHRSGLGMETETGVCDPRGGLD